MTLKAYKEAIQVGTRMRVLMHWIPRQRDTVRTVTKVQTNGYYYEIPGHLEPATGKPTRYWSDHPKSGQLVFDGTRASITLDERRAWVLEFLPAEVPA